LEALAAIAEAARLKAIADAALAQRTEAARLAAIADAESERLKEIARLAALEAERLEAERLEAERLEAERLEAIAEIARLEAERLEAARLEALAAIAEAERLEIARLEAERLEAARLAEIARLAALNNSPNGGGGNPPPPPSGGEGQSWTHLLTFSAGIGWNALSKGAGVVITFEGQSITVTEPCYVGFEGNAPPFMGIWLGEIPSNYAGEGVYGYLLKYFALPDWADRSVQVQEILMP
jgi:hypothetical protein